MMQVIPQTRDEKIAMYMKLTKRELAGMLASANDALAVRPREEQWQITIPSQTYTPPVFTVTTPWPGPNTCGGLN